MNEQPKCKCNNCSENIAFPVEIAGQTIECPHCHLDTILFVPRDWNPAPKENPIPEPTPPPKPIEPEKIEETLDDIGDIFFIVGIVGAVIAAAIIFLILANQSQGDNNIGIIVSLIFFAIVSVGQGIIIKTLFKAAAEVIRLLRQISQNSATIR